MEPTFSMVEKLIQEEIDKGNTVEIIPDLLEAMKTILKNRK